MIFKLLYKLTYDKDGNIYPSLQFLFFIAIGFIILLIGTAVGFGLISAIYGLKTMMAITTLDTTIPHFIDAIWILQLAGTSLPLLLTPIFFAYVIVKDPADYIKPSFRISWQLPVLVFGISLLSFPLIEFLSNLNQKMVLPPFLQWMQTAQDNALKITNMMLQMKNIWSMIFNIVFIGLLTAIAEEFMFRGCLQTILQRWTKNTHVAIWLTAFLFSAFHMEFFGFLPRLMLGATFGYLVAWSGSIWPAVLAHFINNASDVIVTYLSQHNLISIKADDAHVFNNTWYIFSLIIFLLLFWVYRSIALKKPVPQ